MERLMSKKYVLFLIFISLLPACSLRSGHSGSSYEQGELGNPTYFKKGIILSVRDVKIKGTESGVGAVAGATAGGLAGSTSLGGNTATRALGGLGGAVIGGIVGHTTENFITRGNASEFIIQPDEGEPYSIVQENDEELNEGERVLILESGKLRIVRDKNARQ